MLNVGQLNEGFVLDHIEAGKSMMIYNNLGLGELDCQVAIIKNARSSKMGRKDIIKIEGGLKSITVKGKKLKMVGKQALKGINKKAVIRIPKSKKKAYRKLFKGKGQKKSVIVK